MKYFYDKESDPLEEADIYAIDSRGRFYEYGLWGGIVRVDGFDTNELVVCSFEELGSIRGAAKIAYAQMEYKDRWSIYCNSSNIQRMDDIMHCVDCGTQTKVRYLNDCGRCMDCCR